MLPIFLDDNFGIDIIFEKDLEKSTFTSNSLTRAGFIVHSEKSVWQPTEIFTWLSIAVDLNNDALKFSSDRIDSILFTINFILSNIFISARTLPDLSSKLIHQNS